MPRLRSSAFVKLSKIFHKEIPNDGKAYIGIIGLDENKKRAKRFVRKDYIVDSRGLLDSYTVLVAKANGAGNLGKLCLRLLLQNQVSVIYRHLLVSGNLECLKKRKILKSISKRNLREPC